MKRWWLLGLFLVVACASAEAPKPAAVITAKAPAQKPGPRIEWPSAFAAEVHFPLFLDDEIPVCVEVSMPERPTGRNVICEPLGVLRWQITNQRSAK